MISSAYLLNNEVTIHLVIKVKGWVIGAIVVVVVVIGVVAYLMLSGHGIGIISGSTGTISQVYVYLTDKPLRLITYT